MACLATCRAPFPACWRLPVRLGQGQHFAMAGALLHPGTLFPVTIGDGGMGEPYVLNSMLHFNTAYPKVTNFLPVLIWNGYSQEHHSMVSRFTNAGDDRLLEGAWFQGGGAGRCQGIRRHQASPVPMQTVRISRTSSAWRLRAAVLAGIDKAAKSALGGTLTAFIIKQMKGTGVHTVGAKSHNLYPGRQPGQAAYDRRLEASRLEPSEAWSIVRENFVRAGGGPAAKTAVTEHVLDMAPAGQDAAA